MVLFDDGINECAFLFGNPVEEVCAFDHDGVAVAISRLRKGIHQGYYAAGYLTYEAAQHLTNGSVRLRRPRTSQSYRSDRCR